MQTAALTLPRALALEELPAPTDAELRVRAVPAETVVALKLGGPLPDDEVLERAATFLREAAEREGVALLNTPPIVVSLLSALSTEVAPIGPACPPPPPPPPAGSGRHQHPTPPRRICLCRFSSLSLKCRLLFSPVCALAPQPSHRANLLAPPAARSRSPRACHAAAVPRTQEI